MELDELRQMKTGDLRVKERETREEIFRLRLKMRTNQLDNPTNYRKARRELAWILTLLHERTGSHVASEEKKASDAGAD